MKTYIRASSRAELGRETSRRNHQTLPKVDVQAIFAYTAYMQYTLRNIPDSLDKALRRKAKDQQRSLNQVAIELLEQSLGLHGKSVKRRDLSDISGTWQSDPEIDAALADQRQIDPEAWK